jgi:transposase
MTHISRFERSQLLLSPEEIDDYVAADNPVRFIDAFVDGLALKAAGFERVEAKATGHPGYAPGDLLKLYIYGYLNRVRSSRRLEAECHRNIEVIWLLRSLKPDFKTIADFQSDNRAAFKKVFREFVILCRRLDLFGRQLLAVDGMRIKAVLGKLLDGILHLRHFAWVRSEDGHGDKSFDRSCRPVARSGRKRCDASGRRQSEREGSGSGS